MRKKLISLILALMVVLGLCAGITSISVIAKADTEITVDDIFEDTNTYNLKEVVKKEEPKSNESGDSQEKKYEDPQYSFEFDFTAKNGNTTTTAPYVTVFTHGYYSRASDWTNNAKNLDKGANSDALKFQYSSLSMVSEVASNFKGNSLIIKAEVTTETNTKPYYLLGFSIVNQNNINEPLKLENISTTVGSKHLIVIFDGHKTNCSNANIYYQFNYMLSTILNKLKDNYNGKIPKVNLIGHSRGGLTNMQYALDHPDIVANLISIGTPYSD